MYRVYAVFNRFFPTMASLLATAADKGHSGGQNIAGIGLVVGALALPQVLDIGLARRMSIDAALHDTPERRDTEIATVFPPLVLIAASAAGAVAVYGMLTPALRQHYGVAGVLLLAVMGSLAAPTTLLAATASYGWTRPARSRMAAGIAADAAIFAGGGAAFLTHPDAVAFLLGALLLGRSLLNCLVLGAGRILMDMLRAPSNAWSNLSRTVRSVGGIEVRLGLYCFVAWAIDPFLYALFPAPSGTPVHLLATRFAQAFIGLCNVALISALWNGRAGSDPARLDSAATDSLRVTVTAALLLSALGVACAPTVGATAASKALIVASVLLATLLAIWRQHLTLQFAKGKIDLRLGASYPALAAISLVKGAAVVFSSVVLLEAASAMASALYLFNLRQHARRVA